MGVVQLRSFLATVLLAYFALGSVGCAKHKEAGTARRDANVVRYRLPLRENPVDRDAAFVCYGACQEEETPTGYLQCLSACPGFDMTPGVTCASYEVPPYAACITARKVDADAELKPGWVVLAVVAEVAIIVALSSVCASSSTGCASNNPALWAPGTVQ